jgi:hypothetical protein
MRRFFKAALPTFPAITAWVFEKVAEVRVNCFCKKDFVTFKF